MGRIRANVDVNGRESWTLFDSGARNTYVIPSVCGAAPNGGFFPRPTHSKLGGETKSSSQAAVLVARVGGKPIHTEAMVIDPEMRKDERGREDIESTPSEPSRCSSGCIRPRTAPRKR